MPHKISFPLLVWWFKNKNITHFSLYQSQRDGIFHNQVLQCASRTICLQGPSRERSTRCCKASRAVTATLSWISVPLYLAYTKQVDGTTALHVLQLCLLTQYFIFTMYFSRLYIWKTGIVQATPGRHVREGSGVVYWLKCGLGAPSTHHKSKCKSSLESSYHYICNCQGDRPCSDCPGFKRKPRERRFL